MTYRLLLNSLCLWALAVPLSAGVPGQGPPEAPPAAHSSSQAAAAVSQQELNELRARIAQQQVQIEQLRKMLEAQQALLERSMAGLSRAHEQVAPIADAAAAPTAPSPVKGDSALAGGATLVRAVTRAEPAGPQNVAAGSSGSQSQANRGSSPIGFKIGAADFTPVGFLDFTFINRSTNVGSGHPTTFASIPYNSSAAGRLSETSLTAQNSRLGLRVDSTFLGAKVLGYIETDFLGNAANTLQVTSNAATMRLRLYWVDLRKGSFEILGGQSWSMMTPNRKQISPIPGDIFFTQNVDTNYQVGLTWARQAQFRLLYHPSDTFEAGVSLENPQQFVNFTTTNSSGAVVNNGIATLPSNLSSTTVANQFNSNGALNSPTNVPNLTPDVVAKVAFDPKVGGRNVHFELAGLLRTFKYANPVLFPYATHRQTGGGGSVNANVEVFKNVRIIANTFFTQGGGRYLLGTGPDLIIRPNGSISLVHAYSTVDGFEANATKNDLLYSYYGGAYFGRNMSIDTTARTQSYIGYGGPGSPNSANRSIQEFTFGWVRTFWKNNNYGGLSLLTQYSYVWRNPWFVSGSAPRSARTNLYYANLRYTLP